MTIQELLEQLGNTWLELTCRNCGESLRDSLLSFEHNPYNRRCGQCGTELPLTKLVPLVTSIRSCLADWSIEVVETAPAPSNGGMARSSEPAYV
ncbi:MAG: hypothetical protein COZ06_27945 [Armatimonadetes bacterium CG_4_10_14_3_um_filter_66_18]|nr:hypothetical protein [Armatimonadota bacterium]OIP06437.1 MAG: hypothetical protein AUJ96_09025 [Armatimonadetes bacterium CG2_30_66_41]PIU92805.1 MAG: hypothetical protein COS65_15915 [Armatimonadetes bacterium CG06_land_8_20_14_3_00_66_21]PIW13113.1 MAG: hypothetical protein COW34_11390 [Armatimonadetes bacterium CG17_big_fil_post_rev_8_21_14_2_50_66_6]PIX46533.1 MAG: hypothetical protein COZ57_11550 [Armatimonadetes bacterium CG_4_8_14_3_um_filter_66_20]PIY40589.1 MAG: hypothetical prote